MKGRIKQKLQFLSNFDPSIFINHKADLPQTLFRSISNGVDMFAEPSILENTSAAGLGILFVETSAKTEKNVTRALETCDTKSGKFRSSGFLF